jgi:hypothetical protein
MRLPVLLNSPDQLLSADCGMIMLLVATAGGYYTKVQYQIKAVRCSLPLPGITYAFVANKRTELSQRMPILPSPRCWDSWRCSARKASLNVDPEKQEF